MTATELNVCALHKSPASQPEIASVHGDLVLPAPAPGGQHPGSCVFGHRLQPREVDFPSPDCVHVPSRPPPGQPFSRDTLIPWELAGACGECLLLVSHWGQDEPETDRQGSRVPTSSGPGPWSQGEQTTACSLESLLFLVCKKGVFGGVCAKNRAWHIMLILPIIISYYRCKIISLQE